MANTVYPLAKPKLRSRAINLSADTIKGVLVDLGSYTYSASHEFLSDVPGAARVGTPATLTGKTEWLGTFDADDLTLPAVPAGTGTASALEGILLFKDTGTAGTSPLIGLYDTAGGLPVTPDGSPIKITWDATGVISIA